MGENQTPTASQTHASPSALRRVWLAVRWPLWIVLGLYAVLVLYRLPAAFERQKTAGLEAFMFSQKISPSDALGSNLPPAPDQALNDTTLVGADVNSNGIRDDVELTIFKLHPESARVRAATLQYALEAQLELTSVFNAETWLAEAKYEAHSINCLADAAVLTYPNSDARITKPTEWRLEVEALVFNTPARKQKKQALEAYKTSFADSSTISCDIDLAALPN